MTYEVPADAYYLETHEWIQLEAGTGVVGITDYAQDELGDVVFLELPAPGDKFDQGDVFGAIESMKATSDLYAPAGGAVLEINERAVEAPELVNDDPYGQGWLIKIADVADSALEGLLTADEYRAKYE